MKKYSKQRELIIENLRKRKDHPTAEKLFIDLKKEMPELGIATVYRNLTELCDEGIIIKVKSKTGPDRYDGNTKSHIHFECKECRKIVDIYLKEEQKEEIDKITRQLVDEEKFKFENSAIYLEGICQKCKEKTERNI